MKMSLKCSVGCLTLFTCFIYVIFCEPSVDVRLNRKLLRGSVVGVFSFRYRKRKTIRGQCYSLQKIPQPIK